MDKIEMNGLIDKVNCHNRYCCQLFEIVYGKTVDEERFDRALRENLEFGIELCCEMRKAGLDAHVDRLCGAVVNGKQADLTETLDDGSLRYFTFEWADKEGN